MLIPCADEPKYLLTRLLLRKTNKIFSHNELSVKYSSELGEDNVAAYMDILTAPLYLSQAEHQSPKRSSRSSQTHSDSHQHDRFFTADELASLQDFQTALEPSKDQPHVKGQDGTKEIGNVASTSKMSSNKAKILKATNDASNPIVLESSDDEVTALETKPVTKTNSKHAKLDMKKIATGLSKEEEEQDPELAKAIRLSKYEALKKTIASTETPKKLVSRMMDKGKAATLISDTAGRSNSPSNASITVESPMSEPDDFYRLKEGDAEAIAAFARGASEMAVEEMIRHLNMAELTLIAKELKCWKSKYTASIGRFICCRIEADKHYHSFPASGDNHRTLIIREQADAPIICYSSGHCVPIPLSQHVPHKLDAYTRKVASDDACVHAETCEFVFGTGRPG